ncbi:MAG TPA: TRAP transporter substrate-binding protein [Candidatus Blautia avistercoris]|nr:TRAP transporter substrate-binding protein [Candidatus Blautia avistercoris]
MKKKLKNKIITGGLLIFCILASGLAGCGVERSEEGEETAAVGETETSSDAEVSLSFAHNVAVGGAEDQAIARFADRVKELSDGKMEIVVYGSGQLGNERDLIEGVQLGTIDMAMNTSAYLSNLVPQFGMLDLPFLYEDYEDARAKLEGEPGEELKEKMVEEQGIRVLDYWNSGFRVMMTKSAPIHSASDLKGRNMRAPEVDVYVDMFKALGANATPIPFGEVYTSIQTGVVDGVEVCAEEMYTMKFYEVGKYIAVTNHIFSSQIPVINEDVYQGLTEEQREILDQAMSEATDWEWEYFMEADAEALKEMEAEGIEITYPERQEFMDACASMKEEYAEKYDAKDLLEKLDA